MRAPLKVCDFCIAAALLSCPAGPSKSLTSAPRCRASQYSCQTEAAKMPLYGCCLASQQLSSSRAMACDSALNRSALPAPTDHMSSKDRRAPPVRFIDRCGAAVTYLQSGVESITLRTTRRASANKTDQFDSLPAECMALLYAYDVSLQ